MRTICSIALLGMGLAACGSDEPGTGAGAAGALGVSGSSSGGAASGAPPVVAGGGSSVGGAAAGANDSAGSAGATSGAGTSGTANAGSAGMGGGEWPSPDPGVEGDGRSEVAGDKPKQNELKDLKNPVGKEFSFTLESKIYQFTEPTIAANSPKNQPRMVWVYVPAQYVDGSAAPFMVIQDGQQSGRYGLIKYAIDNLTASKDATRKVPPFIAIAVQDGGGDGPNNERGLEYDTVSDRYARFVQNEVLPAVVADSKLKAAFPNFRLTDNPEGRATFGCSSGGAAALTMAWFHPEWFRRVVTYSGTFVALQNSKLPEHDTYPDGAWDYHHDKNIIANSPKKALRIFNNANDGDNGHGEPESGKRNWVIANEATHTALAAKGYHNRFVYGLSSGHCDSNVLEGTLADTLVWVWRGYPSN